MLTRLYADNYKCLVNFDLRLGDATLLLGTNGAGKSSVLDVVYRLKQVLVGGRRVGDPEAFPAGTLTLWDRRDIQTIALDVDLDDERFEYRLEVEHERDTGRVRVRLESLAASGGALFHCEFGEAQLYKDDHSEGPRLSVDWTESFLGRVSAGRSNTRLTRFMDFMRRLVVCRLNPAGFAANASRESTLLARDGGNFAAWYRHLLQEHPEKTLEMVSELRKVIDGFRSMRMERAGSDTRTMSVVFAGEGGDYSLQLDEVSDGERILLVLYTLLALAADQPYTLLIDEPDNFLALPEIQPWLMALSDACSDSRHQAVICSHHPELIDYLGAEKGVLLERTNGGVTTVRDACSLSTEDGLRLSERVARGWVESTAETVAEKSRDFAHSAIGACAPLAKTGH